MAIDESGDQASRRARGRTLTLACASPTTFDAAVALKLLGFLSDARLFVKPPPLQFAEESFPREFFLGNFESFLDIIIEDFNFHAFSLHAFPGDACIGFSFVPY